MNFNELQPDILGLQEDAINLLEQTDVLINQASGELQELINKVSKEADQETDTKELKVYKKSEISASLKNLKNLELRMTVAATAKSGKSTFINAISGQNILPSRQIPMTALPTEIVFSNESIVPKLTLHEDILSTLKQIIHGIEEELRKSESQNHNNLTEDLLHKFPEVEDLIEKIKSHTLIFNKEVNSTLEINRILTDLNDTIRVGRELCSHLTAQISDCTIIPRIEVSFCDILRIQINKNTDDRNYEFHKSKLVIVDTPGSNEFIQENNNELWISIISELGKSLIILFIIDSNQLPIKDLITFKNKVQEILEKSEKRDFYVLVNKIDQNVREEDTLKPEKLLKKVATLFGVNQIDITNRVFATSGVWAFTAVSFLENVQNLSDDQVPGNIEAHKDATQRLLKETRPAEWKRQLPILTKEELQKSANDLLEESGFEPFLNGVLQILMIESVPRIVLGALARTLVSLKNFSEQIQIQDAINKAQKDSKQIQYHIEILEKKLHQIEQIKDDQSLRQEQEKIKICLEEKIDKILQKIKNGSMKKLKDKGEELEFSILKIQEHQGNKVTLEEQILDESDSKSKFIVSLSKYVDSKDSKIRGKDLIVCKNKNSFDELTLHIVNEIKDVLKKEVSNDKKKDFEKIYNDKFKLLNDLLFKATNEIVNDVTTEFKKALNITINPPVFSDILEDFNVEISPDNPKNNRNIFSVVFNFSKQIWQTLKSLILQEPQESGEEYCFNVEKAYSPDLTSIFTDIKKDLINRVDEDIERYISSFYREIDEWLKTYQSSLILAKIKKDGNRLNYKDFGEKVNELKTRIKRRLVFAESLMKK